MARATVRLADGAGHVDFFAGKRGPRGKWRPSGREARAVLLEHVFDVIDELGVYSPGNEEYELAGAFAERVGGRVIHPRRRPAVKSVPGRVY